MKKKNIFSYFRTSRLPPEEADEVLRSVFGDKNDYSRYFNWVGVTYRTAGFVFLVVFLVYLLPLSGISPVSPTQTRNTSSAISRSASRTTVRRRRR